jgi:hypothetical protein
MRPAVPNERCLALLSASHAAHILVAAFIISISPASIFGVLCFLYPHAMRAGTLKQWILGPHFWRLQGWHTLLREAQLWSSRATLLTLKKRPLPLAGVLGDEPPQAWVDDFDQLVFKGNARLDEVLFFHKQSGTVILDDLIQIHPDVKGKPPRNALVKLEGVGYPHGGVGLDIRLSFTNRNLARRSLEKLLSWDFDKLIIAHGDCIEKDAKPFVRKAFRWLVLRAK